MMATKKHQRGTLRTATNEILPLMRYEANGWANDDGVIDCYVVEAVRLRGRDDLYCEQEGTFPATEEGEAAAEELAAKLNARLEGDFE